MKKNFLWVLMAFIVVALTGCGGKKKSNDIITKRVTKVTPRGPERMQPYDDTRNVDWIGRKYHVAIHRQPADSLPKVKDETGQQYVDNVISVAVSRQDGSVFFSRTFTKSDFKQFLDADYTKTGIFEGLVFDKADGDYLEFAASVSHPGTDEYIPMVVRLSRMGDIAIRRDTQMDTNSAAETTGDIVDDDDI